MDTLLFPIKWVIAWIMYGIHTGLTAIGLPDGPGIAWILAIVGLTIVVRILIIPLYNKQIRSQRAQQELQPELQRLQKKYKGRKDPVSQQRQQQEMMAIYKDAGTSPFAACFPLLIQMPIMLSLFRLLYSVKPLSEGLAVSGRTQIGPINQQIATDIGSSQLFGAPLDSAISTASEYANRTSIYIVAAVLILLLVVTLFFQQKQIMTKNMPARTVDPDNPMANSMQQMQKVMLYGMPLIYLFTGFAFQIGVLVYWVTGNFWNIGQQTWMLVYNPTPGSPAHKAKLERDKAKRIKKGLPPLDEDEEEHGQRVQPLGRERSKKAGARAAAPSGDENIDNIDDIDSTEVRGPDGLTDAERAQKRYERRQAERARAKAKKAERQKKINERKKDRNF